MTNDGGGCRLACMVFFPMVMDTFWRLEQSDVMQLKLGTALARDSREEESEKIRHLYLRLAFLLVKANRALFLNRLPNHPIPMIERSE
jgi:hypothetical protein